MQGVDYLKEAVIFSKFQIAKLKSSNKNEVSSIYKDGYFLSSGLLSAEEILGVNEIVDDLFSTKSINIWSDDQGADKRIYGVEKIEPRIKELIPLDRAMRLGEEYLGRKISDYFILAGCIEHKDGNVGSGGGWHRDSPFSHQFKMIIYLTDVNENNGPFEYFKKSHLSLEKIKSDFSLRQMRFTHEEAMKFPKEDLVEFCGKGGDVLFVDTRGVHRGKPLITGIRKAITVYFFENAKSKKNFNDYMQD